MTALPLTFAPQAYPGGRILLMLGRHEVGVIFPPALPDADHRNPWKWSFWLTTPSRKEGAAKTLQAAQNALLAEARDWLHKAGLA